LILWQVEPYDNTAWLPNDSSALKEAITS